MAQSISSLLASYIASFSAMYVIYVTWAGGICLICTHKSEGAQRPRASVDISGKCQPHMLYMLCNTFGTPKICWVCYSLYCPLHNDGYCLWLWVFNSNVSMTFIKIHSVMQYFWSWDLMARVHMLQFVPTKLVLING